MFRAIGVVIILYALSQFFSNSFSALDGALTETFAALQVAATVSQDELKELR